MFRKALPLVMVFLGVVACSQAAPPRMCPDNSAAGSRVEVAALSASGVPVISLELPSVSPTGTVVSVVGVAVDAAGEATFDGKRITDAARLRDHVDRARAKDSTAQLVLFVDKRAEFRHVVRLLDYAKQAGVDNVMFGVRPPHAPHATRARPKSGRVTTCPFPPEADGANADEAQVVVEVPVDALGHVVGAKAETDPGHGFANAAVACAKAIEFDPARNAEGEPSADSLRLRLRFSR